MKNRRKFPATLAPLVLVIGSTCFLSACGSSSMESVGSWSGTSTCVNPYQDAVFDIPSGVPATSWRFSTPTPEPQIVRLTGSKTGLQVRWSFSDPIPTSYQIHGGLLITTKVGSTPASVSTVGGKKSVPAVEINLGTADQSGNLTGELSAFLVDVAARDKSDFSQTETWNHPLSLQVAGTSATVEIPASLLQQTNLPSKFWWNVSEMRFNGSDYSPADQVAVWACPKSNGTLNGYTSLNLAGGIFTPQDSIAFPGPKVNAKGGTLTLSQVSDQVRASLLSSGVLTDVLATCHSASSILKPGTYVLCNLESNVGSGVEVVQITSLTESKPKVVYGPDDGAYICRTLDPAIVRELISFLRCTSTNAVVPTTTAPVSSSAPDTSTASPVSEVITYGSPSGEVVWRTGDPLGENPGPYYCCHPMVPGSTDSATWDYSGSRGCSGGAGANGDHVGGYYSNGRLC